MNKKFAQLALALAAAASGSAATAAVIDFESMALDVFAAAPDAGFVLPFAAATMTVNGDGFAGAVVNQASCDQSLSCPTGNSGQYYMGINDGSLTLSTGAPFQLSSFDFAFVKPSSGLPDGFTVGQMMVSATSVSGQQTSLLQNFALDGNGAQTFSTWNFMAQVGQHQFSSVTFSACLFDGNGACVNPANGGAQFGLDNINVTTAVPEPSSWALMALGLAGFAALSRRRQAD